MTGRRPSAAVFLAAVACLPVPAPRSPPRVAVFPLGVVDTSGESPNPQWPERIATVTHVLAGQLAGSHRYRAVEVAPPDPTGTPIHQCVACWRDPARKAGAEMAAIAVVQKMSRLISSLHIWLVDVESGQHHATDGLTLAGRPPRSSLPRARSPASAPRFDPWQNRPDRPASRHSRRGRDLRELLIWAAILALLALVYANHGRFLEIG